MTDTINEALLPIKQQYEGHMKLVLEHIKTCNNIIFDKYEEMLNGEPPEAEDRDLLLELRRLNGIINHYVNHQVDLMHRIGKPRHVERYFNFENGEPVEVDKSEYVGTPDDGTTYYE